AMADSFRPTNERTPRCVPSAQSERSLISVEDGFHFGPVVRLHLSEADDLAHDLSIVAHRLSLGVGVADIVSDTLLFFLKAFDAFDEEAQAVVGGIGHRIKLR